MDIVKKLELKIKEILNERFRNERYKTEILEKPGRLNFACPYCGDSAKDPWKKRGNFYIKSLSYHCFNCNIHKSAEALLKDFDKFLAPVDYITIHENRETVEQKKNLPVDLIDFFNIKTIEKFAVPKEELIKKMNWVPAKDSEIEIYLKNRLQYNLNRFAWDRQNRRLIIFNLTSDGNGVLGLQMRNFRRQPKYLTGKLDKIYTLMGKPVPKDGDFEKVNNLSTFFGLTEIDYRFPITVFEGPMDAFLFKNSVATCSAHTDFPYDIPVRYFYDYDKIGIQKSIEKIKKGIPVFLWQKYLKDNNLKINKNKIDLTVLLQFARDNNIHLKSFEGYFSESKFDIYWV